MAKRSLYSTCTVRASTGTTRRGNGEAPSGQGNAVNQSTPPRVIITDGHVAVHAHGHCRAVLRPSQESV